MKCPQCGGSCWRDEFDIGVGTQYGPWNCEECGWYEGHQFDEPPEDFDGPDNTDKLGY